MGDPGLVDCGRESDHCDDSREEAEEGAGEETEEDAEEEAEEEAEEGAGEEGSEIEDSLDFLLPTRFGGF